MHDFLNRLGCAGLVTALVFPFGQQLFPLIGSATGEAQFAVAEAIIVAALGMGLHAMLYGRNGADSHHVSARE
jgi:hypothetical protein